MTREEKISDLINNLMSNWSSMKDFDQFVKTILYEGFEGFSRMSDEMINKEYYDVFEKDDVELQEWKGV